MSIFVPRVIACPHCGHRERRDIAESIHGPRALERVGEVLDGSFQRFTCGPCQQAFVVDEPFVYIDFQRKHWIMQYPAAWEDAWRDLESAAAETFQDTMVVNAPPMVRERMATGFRVRAVFGLDALRDKLACLLAGIDDLLLEMAKLELMRASADLPFNALGRPRLASVPAASKPLCFAVHTATSGDTGGRSTLTVERVFLDEFERRREASRGADDDPWAPLEQLLAEGSYVDLGRLFIPGDRPAPRAPAS